MGSWGPRRWILPLALVAGMAVLGCLSDSGSQTEGSSQKPHVRREGEAAAHVQRLSVASLKEISLNATIYEVFLDLPFPSSLKEVGMVTRAFERYANYHYSKAIGSIMVLAIFLQTFCIPGTIFFNVLLGSLFGYKVAMVVAVACGTIGASACYSLSWMLGRRLFTQWFPDRIRNFSKEVDGHREDLFPFLLFLRISPLLPNWLINIASPIIEIPFLPFCMATCLGIIPQTFIAVEAGRTVKSITDDDAKLFQPKTALSLLSIAFVALIPFAVRRWLLKRRPAPRPK